MSTIKYRPEIDGLRALAIIPVLLFHFNTAWIGGGFMGVDVFFVISGYLITSIILTELGAGTFTFRAFWERRVRRIFPALAVMIISCLAFAWLLFYPGSQLSLLGRQAFKVLALVSNQYMLAITGDYWGPSAESIPLLHTWSLAVEEQFYLFLPLLIFAVFRWWNRKWIFPILLLLTVSSFIYCINQTQVNQPAAFYLLTSRAWELLLGSMLAALAPFMAINKGSKICQWIADLGVVAIIASYFVITAEGFPGWKAIVPVLGATFFIGFSAAGGYMSALLQKRPFIFVGKASYSLYLWHWPALVFGQLFAGLFEAPSIRWWAFGVSLLISIGSYLWVERIGKLTKSIWKPAGALLGIVILLSVMAIFNNRDLTPTQNAVTESKGRLYECVYINQRPPSVNNINKSLNDKDDLGIRDYLPDKKTPINPFGFEPVRINYDKPQDMVVLGDSHALMWGSVIERIAQKSRVGCEFWASSGASPLLDSLPARRGHLDVTQRAEFNKQRIKAIELHKPKVVIISTRLDDKWQVHAATQYLQGIEDLIIAVHNASPGSHVVIIGQPPVSAFGNQNAVQWLGMRETFFYSETTRMADGESWMAANKYISTLPNKFNFVQVIKVSDFYELPANRIQIIKNKHIIYTDDDHLSEFGASLAENRMRLTLEPLLN